MFCNANLFNVRQSKTRPINISRRYAGFTFDRDTDRPPVRPTFSLDGPPACRFRRPVTVP